jgi:hypothetical protein
LIYIGRSTAFLENSLNKVVTPPSPNFCCPSIPFLPSTGTAILKLFEFEGACDDGALGAPLPFAEKLAKK